MSQIIRPSIINNNPPQLCRWHGFSSTKALEEAAVQTILEYAQQAISDRSAFHLVLAGGTTPRRVYEILSSKSTNWNAWHIYYGDERCLPIDHADRNSQMATKAWLEHVKIPTKQIHIIPAEMGADIAARAYAQTMKDIELFDLVILGLGEDGHTASLFPDHDWGNHPGSPATLAVNDAPKPPPHRVTLSAHRLSQTRHLVFLVSGASKQNAVTDWRNGKNIPAAAISPKHGVDVYLERIMLIEA